MKITINLTEAQLAELKLRFAEATTNAEIIYRALDVEPPPHGGARRGAGRPQGDTMRRVKIESSYHPGRGYHLDGASREIKFPRRRWFDTHEEMMAAVEALNPDCEFI